MASPASTASARGRALRSSLPRSAQADLQLPNDRDPVAILEQQHASRLSELVPVRIGRMAESVFSYYRGTAAVMAADLAQAPTTGVEVVSCGDAHVSNFGFFASPERSLLFDLNDFDEAGVGPWEWDVKRLAASAYIGGRDIGMDSDTSRRASALSVQAYRTSLRGLMKLTALERYFYLVDSSRVERMLSTKAARAAVKKARKRTSSQLLGTLALHDDAGVLRIVDQPPITRHVEHASLPELTEMFQRYLGTLREDAAWLLSQFRLVDYVLRVVGVGSVGTRCYVLAFEGPDDEVLFLQAKEAQPSVLTSYGLRTATIPGSRSEVEFTDGHRVVAGQRILQAHSDPFIGHIVGWAGEQGDRPRVDYYWRQFRDMKGSIDPSILDDAQFTSYAQLCGRMLARAHSQSPGANVIAAYLGAGTGFDEAIADWSAGYGAVCEADFAALRQAIACGRLPAATDH